VRLKRRTREHVIADLSVNHVERFILRCGFTVVRTGTSDYGIDLIVSTYTAEGELENGDLKIQVKATDRPKLVDGGKFISVRFDTAQVVYWRLEKSPVILVLYDAGADRAYWLDVQDWTRTIPRIIRNGRRRPCESAYLKEID